MRVVIGAGNLEFAMQNNPGWIYTQEHELNLLQDKDWANRFTHNSLEMILAEHVWEHLSYDEGVTAARICRPYLKENGRIRCAVPDGYFPDPVYQRGVQVGGPGPQDHPAASHKIVHNYQSIKKMFEEAGYQVDLLEYCDEEGEFHYHPWNASDGLIYRSKRFDHRNRAGDLGFVSLIVDAWKGSLYCD
ncbi:SAM-dependent methyltransferase [Hazenella sp. IB182353]|uniref:class I SAM-dependent methyltransferase n=1 Tax=Polycladospora coralii TaxID=2771432 RepID=UPI0017469D7B|nr:SAM-dependent methyltransferase [Polycladospora coralii]MBS7531141.1 SAM-dependent methyltransferase [Polycladospora coralii]